MRTQGKKIETAMFQFPATGIEPTVRIVDAVVKSADIYVMPFSYLPMSAINQLSIRWLLTTMPDLATQIFLTPIFFEAIVFKDSGGTSTPYPGFIDDNGSAFDRAFVRMTFDDLDGTNNYVIPKTYRILKTVADGTVSVLGSSHQLGTRASVPVCEGMFGVLVQHNGTTNTGSHSVFVTASWA